MKIIELLNRIANGEEVPEKIKWHDKVWIRDFEDAYYYYEAGADNLFMDDIGNTTWLNKEVEIIEEDKKIEKIKNINIDYCIDGKLYEHLTKEEIALDIQTIRHKLDEIIDYINKEDK